MKGHLQLKLIFVFQIILFLISRKFLVKAEVFTLGYLTGSQRRVDNLDYSRPGLTISGAISLAIAKVNAGKLKDLGHSLSFIVAETYGEEISSIRQTASLWTQHVSGYIGPQETCVHEGRMAAAFNLPMISYFCAHRDTSNKKDFPTFARTRPPDTQISKSVVSLLLAFNWTQVTFLYLDTKDEEYSPIADTIIEILRVSGVNVRMTLTWTTIYHHGFTRNPFDEIVERTYANTRSHHFEHIGLMISLKERGLLEKGEYFVVGVDIEQYDPAAPDKYMQGSLLETPDSTAEKAFQSYLGIYPTAPFAFKEFAQQVNMYMERPPFQYPNPLGYFGGTKQIRAEAAYLYDAVHLYANALVKVIEEGGNPRNGCAIIDAAKGNRYLSAMGYMVYIDENGDAAGNYTVLARGIFRNISNTTKWGLMPVGTFSAPNSYIIPDLKLFTQIDWIGGAPPVAEPLCGFRGEKCISYTGEISAGIAGGALLLLGIVSLVLYRNWRYEQELDSLLWKIDFREIQMHDSDKDNNGQQKRETRVNRWSGMTSGALLSKLRNDDIYGMKGVSKTFNGYKNNNTIVNATHPLIRTSQVSLSSNPDADFRYSTIFTPIGLYKGQLYAIKKIRKKSVDITREMKKELKLLRDTRHDNICAFIGACTEPPNVCVITEYCTRGSLKDILENEDVKLDNMFIASMVADIIRGVIYLHDSPLRFHGSLCTSNCLIDSRWVVKLSDFGLFAFKKGSEQDIDAQNMASKCTTLTNPYTLTISDINCICRTLVPEKLSIKTEELLYRAPELLRAGPPSIVPGNQKGDSYSFGIVLYEIHTRHGPFGETGLSPMECLRRVLQPPENMGPYRPSLQPLETSFDCVRECLRECWNERPEERPDFKTIRTKLRPLRKGMKPNIFDNMMSMMEKYANNLEALVDERTDQLQEEKKKTEALLLEMLPRPVAEQLKKGNKVDPESYDMVTIYFSDIVGFTSMSANSTPLQIVDLLNDLYTLFDSITGNYDVYKVETIGDAYMVVSGLPIRNGDIHAAEIASMSLHLLSAVMQFRIRHKPEEQLYLRIGIHSGPVCAGVVGLKMPRYCLFGDTVNTASRMESSGIALKIHCSKPCKLLLDKLGGYQCEERGIVDIKGKGEQFTYWLLGEDEDAKTRRTAERSQRRGSRALNKFLQSQIKANMANGIDPAQRSSLKNRNIPRNSLTRSSSLESPKKLRFATGSLLEHHRYHSDDALLEVISDSSPRKSSGGSIAYDDMTSSCPCIDDLGISTDRKPCSYPTATTPLLSNHIDT